MKKNKGKLYQIGEISKLCNIPIKTLRYYDEIDLLKPSKIDEETNYRYYSVDQLVYILIIKQFKDAGFSLKEIKKFLDRDDLEESKRKITDDRVLLSTIHSVKGMEFKNVFIINCNEDSIPHYSGKKENLDEERRLFYVGITRAIDNLYLFAPRSRRGTFKDPSQFLIEGGFVKESKPLHGLSKGDEVLHRSYGNGKIIMVNGDEITIEFNNGIKRKFSGKVLIENKLLIII